MQELKRIIDDQRAGHENEPLWMVGQQLLDMAAEDPQKTPELLKQDLTVSGMGLKDAAAALKAYADKNRGKRREFCITPNVAEQILREFYKLPERDETAQKDVKEINNAAAEEKKPAFGGLSLADFL